MATCLTQAQANRVKAALDRGDFDIDKMAEMSTDVRKKELVKYMDEEAVANFNRNFEDRIMAPGFSLESKIKKAIERVEKLKSEAPFLKTEKQIAANKQSIERAQKRIETLKQISPEEILEAEVKIAERQRITLLSYVQREIDAKRIPKPSRNDIVNRVGKVQHMLDDREMRGVLRDIVSQKLGVGMSPEAMEDLTKLGRKATDAKGKLSDGLVETSKRIKPIYMKRPEVVEQIKEANKLSGAEKKNALEAIDTDAQSFADAVWNGSFKEDGVTTLTKAEYKELLKPRLELAKDIENLSAFMNDLHRAVEKVSRHDFMAAEGAYKKTQVAGRLARKALYETFAFGKSVVASMDFSYMLRQGWQTAFTNPEMLFKNSRLAFIDGMKSTRAARKKSGEGGGFWDKYFPEFDNNAYDFARLEINTRANALNGKYDRAANGYGLNIFKEEQFPSSIAERLPVVGNAFKGSEVAYNSLALRMRADLADTFIAKLEKSHGADFMYNKDNADALGLLVGSMTGRGLPFGIKAFEGTKATEVLNVAFFSPRFVGSQFYTLAAPFKWIGKADDPIAKLAGQKAAQAFVEVAGLIFTLNMVGEMFWDEAIVDTNPGSKNFGYLTYGDYAWDMTGAHGSVIALIGQMFNSRNGQSYDHRLGIYKDSVWSQDTIDIASGWLLNKTSPTASIIKEFINGKNFGEDDFSWTTSAFNILTPLTISISIETLMKDPTSADAYLVIMGELIGIPSKDMRISPLSKDWKELKAADPKKYNQAVTDLNKMLFEDIEKLRNDTKFQKLPREEQDKEIERLARAQKSETVDKYLDQVK